MNSPPPRRSRPPPSLDSPHMERRRRPLRPPLALGGLVSGVREDPDFRALAILVAGLMGSGTIFYMLVEGWNFVDAIYFCTIVLTTVGLGDVSPTNDAAKIFTIFYALTGIGVLVAFGTAFAQRLVKQSEARPSRRRR